MSNLEKIFQLVAREQKPCFVVSTDGEAVVVVMPLAEYQRLQPDAKYDELAARVNALTRQTEELNREITQAQMEEFEEQEITDSEAGDAYTPAALEAVYIEPINDPDERI